MEWSGKLSLIEIRGNEAIQRRFSMKVFGLRKEKSTKALTIVNLTLHCTPESNVYFEIIINSTSILMNISDLENGSKDVFP